MKRIIFIVIAVIIMLTTVYLLFGEGVIPFETTRLREEGFQSVYKGLQLIIGNRVQSSSTKLVNEMTRRFTLSLLIELKKIEYIVGSIEADKFIEGNDDNINMLLKQVDEISSIEKIRVINDDYELLKTTSDTDIIGLNLDEEIYSEIFTTSALGNSSIILDNLTNEIVIGRRIDQRYALLFYYSMEFIDSLFSSISGLEYKRIEPIQPKFIIINFPDFGVGEEGSVSRIKEAVRSEKNGWVKVRSEDHEEIIFFESVSEPLSDWKIGLAVERERFTFSILGFVIFGIQAVALFVILLFIITTVKEKRWGIGTSAPQRRYAAAVARKGILKGAGVVGGVVSPTGQKKVQLSESALVSLEELEEVFELEEVGEAVIAEELEEFEDEKSNDTNKDEATEQSNEAAELSDETPISDTLDEFDGELEKRREKSDEEELADLEAVQREIMGPEAQMLEEIDTLKQLSQKDENLDQVLGQEEPEEENIFDDYPEIREKTESSPDSLPDLESLVKAESGINTDKGKDTAPKISVDVAESEVDSVITDNLASIFKKIEQSGVEALKVTEATETTEGSPARGSPAGMTDVAELRKRFRQFMKYLQVSKGAVLLRESSGLFKPVSTVGLSRETKRKLPFKGNEKILINILNKDKILFIQNEAFFSGILQKKFDSTDSSTIKSIFFCPIITGTENDVEAVEGHITTKKQNAVQPGLIKTLKPTFLGFLIICPKEDDKTSSDRILKELKGIKKKIKNIF